MNAVHPPQVDCITESGTPYGYWWRYQHSPGEPEVTLTAVIMIAGEVAITEARQRAKTHCVARATAGPDAIYVFACDHPDAHNAAINVMYKCTPAGEAIYRPGRAPARVIKPAERGQHRQFCQGHRHTAGGARNADEVWFP